MPNNLTDSHLQGWTASPDGRGSIDILWSCLVTIFLSTWSAICLNVPEPADTMWTYLKRKVWITFIAVMGPEYLLGFAMGQWQSARVSVARFKALRQDDKWTLRHAFFADMGGFVLKTSDDVTFFLDTKHILWLAEHDAMSKADFERSFLIDRRSIDDRNKSDVFVRVIAVGQALWFCINLLARGVQHLAVTTLEVTTVGIIIDSILVYYVWKDKPSDIEYTDTIEINMTLDELLRLETDESARTQPYFRTPLDFVSREVWSFQLIYLYLINILKNMRPGPPRKRSQKSLGRRSDNDVLPIDGLGMLLATGATIAFLGTNFIPWNFHFPTPTERLIWRISSCGLVGISLIGIGIIQIFYTQPRLKIMQEKVRQRRRDLADSRLSTEKLAWTHRVSQRLRMMAMRFRNNSPEQDPDRDVSLVFVLLVVPGFAVYTILRLYILGEDFAAFRAMPDGAFATVNWWKFVPHIG